MDWIVLRIQRFKHFKEWREWNKIVEVVLSQETVKMKLKENFHEKIGILRMKVPPIILLLFMIIQRITEDQVKIMVQSIPTPITRLSSNLSNLLSKFPFTTKKQGMKEQPSQFITSPKNNLPRQDWTKCLAGKIKTKITQISIIVMFHRVEAADR